MKASLSDWDTLLPCVPTQDPGNLLPPPPWNLDPRTGLFRLFLALFAIFSVWALHQATGELFSEDNDMLLYLGVLILISLYLGPFPAFAALVLTLTLLSLGQGHSGFQIRPGRFQYLISFGLFSLAVFQVSRMAEAVHREAWRARQKARVLERLRDIGRQSARIMVPQQLQDQLQAWLQLIPEPPHRSRFWEHFEAHLREQVRLASERIEHTEAYRKASILEATQEQQATLISCMSHDLQTPLSTILGTFEALLECEAPLKPEQRQQLLQLGHSQAQRLLHLARNLLNLSKLEGGALQLRRRALDPVELVEAAVRAFDLQQQARIRWQPPAEPSPWVWGDHLLLVQVLVNLLDNALKFSHSDLPVGLSLAAKEDEVSFSVEDRGMGIQSGEAETLFQKFQRGQMPQVIPGSGLGLYICRGIVEMHGGHLKLDPAWTPGCRFCFFLPLRDGP